MSRMRGKFFRRFRVLLFLFLLIFFIGNLSISVFRYYSQYRQKSLLYLREKERREELLREKERIARETERLENDPEYKKSLIKKELGYVEKGEVPLLMKEEK